MSLDKEQKALQLQRQKPIIDGQTVYIGSPGLFRQLRVSLERLEPEIERLQADAAIEAADIALMGDDPSGVAYALKLAKASQRINSQNIVFSILVLVVLIPGAILGLLGITTTVFAHEASELVAIANGLRITRQQV